MNSVQTASLRKLCFDAGVALLVVKNRLLKKAMENQEEKDFSSFFDLLKENTSIMISESSNSPAKNIKDFLEKNDIETPIIKGAHIENEIYLGHDQIETLATLKSKEELIGEIITLLSSPMKNLISSLNSSSTSSAIRPVKSPYPRVSLANHRRLSSVKASFILSISSADHVVGASSALSKNPPLP